MLLGVCIICGHAYDVGKLTKCSACAVVEQQSTEFKLPKRPAESQSYCRSNPLDTFKWVETSWDSFIEKQVKQHREYLKESGTVCRPSFRIPFDAPEDIPEDIPGMPKHYDDQVWQLRRLFRK